MLLSRICKYALSNHSSLVQLYWSHPETSAHTNVYGKGWCITTFKWSSLFQYFHPITPTNHSKINLHFFTTTWIFLNYDINSSRKLDVKVFRSASVPLAINICNVFTQNKAILLPRASAVYWWFPLRRVNTPDGDESNILPSANFGFYFTAALKFLCRNILSNEP